MSYNVSWFDIMFNDIGYILFFLINEYCGGSFKFLMMKIGWLLRKTR